MEDALFLTHFARQVTIIHRRETFRASPILVEQVQNHPKIRFILSSCGICDYPQSGRDPLTWLHSLRPFLISSVYEGERDKRYDNKPSHFKEKR